MEIWKLIADFTSEKNTIHFQKSQVAIGGFIILKLDEGTIVFISDWRNGKMMAKKEDNKE